MAMLGDSWSPLAHCMFLIAAAESFQKGGPSAHLGNFEQLYWRSRWCIEPAQQRRRHVVRRRKRTALFRGPSCPIMW
jgi:hypothetical protein